MAGKKAMLAAGQTAPTGQERPEDVLRDLLERALEIAEEASYPVMEHIISMGLEELDELEGRGSYYALILREAKTPRERD